MGNKQVIKNVNLVNISSTQLLITLNNQTIRPFDLSTDLIKARLTPDFVLVLTGHVQCL